MWLCTSVDVRMLNPIDNRINTSFLCLLESRAVDNPIIRGLIPLFQQLESIIKGYLASTLDKIVSEKV